jgi:putative spermidine/putrescine transport system permease protein
MVRISLGEGALGLNGLTMRHFAAVLSDPYYLSALGRTVGIGAAAVLGTLLPALPLAYFMLKQPAWRVPLIGTLVGPLVISVVVRLYGWQLLLSESGPVNNLISLVLGDNARVIFIGNWSGVIVTMVHTLLPYMCIAIFNSMQTINPAVLEAAETLGANPWRVFLHVVLPLSARGTAVGIVLVFSLAAASFIVPAVMGAGKIDTIPTLVYQEALVLDFPSASALAMVLLVVLLPLSMLSSRSRANQ